MLFLSESDRQSLLSLARRAITEAVSRGGILADIPAGGIFSQRVGIFVSLQVGKRLRGCIGLVEIDAPLGESVVRCAVGAATHDPRFPPLLLEELGNLRIEISLLSPPLAIRPEEIEIGSHGLLISQGPRRGILLPQVAVKHRLSAEQFLAETCRKAQLSPDAWRDPEASLFGFTCEVFSSGAPSMLATHRSDALKCQENAR
jgi:AmmeMemoRadiSam system protein A